MSCEGCLTSNKGQNEQLEIITARAKEYAKEISEPVAVYKEGYEYNYAKYSVAKEQQYNVVNVVSQYS